MHRWKLLLWTVLVLPAALLLTGVVSARVAAPPPLSQRVALAEMIVIGRVIGLEDKDVETALFPGEPMMKFRIAVVNVGDMLHGAKGSSTIRVGFVPPPSGAGGGRPIRGGYFADLKTGQECLLLLRKAPRESFYVVGGAFDVIDGQDRNHLDREAGKVRRYVELLKAPAASLQSKKAEDRLLTAALLLARYRIPQPGATATEPIEAAESKLILHALLDADWMKFDPELRTSGLNLFLQLGLTPQDGWNPPQKVKNFQQEYTDAGKAWLRIHADTYRIRRFVMAQKKE
jgi:hypothetical protein